MESQTHIGHWWLPSNPSKALHGSLTYSADEGASLDLTGSFHDIRALGTNQEVVIIHGTTVAGKSITLFRCMNAGQTIYFGGTPTSRYSARFVIIGDHFQDPDSIAFQHYRVRYSFLEQWIAQAVFQHTFEEATPTTPTKRIITYTVPDEITATLPDFTLRLTSQYSATMGYSVQPAIAHTNAVKIESPELRPLERFLGSSHFLIQNFLTLGIGRPTRLVELTARRDDILVQIAPDRTVPQDFTILFRTPEITSEKATIHPHEMIFSFPDISDRFEEILKKWFQAEATLRPVYNLYFATLNATALYLDHEFLNFIYALESYHRRTRPGKYLDDAAVDSVREALTKAIPDNVPIDFRSSLQQKLKYINEYSLRRRLKEILDDLAEDLTPFIPNRGAFTDAVVNTRNYMTHHDPVLEKDSLTGESLYWASRRLRALVELCLMTTLGFSNAQLQKIVQSRQPFAIPRDK